MKMVLIALAFASWAMGFISWPKGIKTLAWMGTAVGLAEIARSL